MASQTNTACFLSQTAILGGFLPTRSKDGRHRVNMPLHFALGSLCAPPLASPVMPCAAALRANETRGRPGCLFAPSVNLICVRARNGAIVLVRASARALLRASSLFCSLLCASVHLCASATTGKRWPQRSTAATPAPMPRADVWRETDLSQIRSSFGQCLSTLAPGAPECCGRTRGQFDFRATSGEYGQCWAMSANFGETSTNIGATPTHFGHG